METKCKDAIKGFNHSIKNKRSNALTMEEMNLLVLQRISRQLGDIYNLLQQQDEKAGEDLSQSSEVLPVRKSWLSKLFN